MSAGAGVELAEDLERICQPTRRKYRRCVRGADRRSCAAAAAQGYLSGPVAPEYCDQHGIFAGVPRSSAAGENVANFGVTAFG